LGIINDFYTVVSKLKRKKTGRPTPKLCPRCGTSNLRLSSGVDAYPRMYGLTPAQYVCESCGYTGPIVLELEKDKR
jgi:C4-type Zn-finger protein